MNYCISFLLTTRQNYGEDDIGLRDRRLAVQLPPEGAVVPAEEMVGVDEAVGIAEKLPHTLGVGIMAVKKP